MEGQRKEKRHKNVQNEPDEGDKQYVCPTPIFREFAFNQQVIQFKAYIDKYQQTVIAFRSIDDKLLGLSHQGNNPHICQLKKKRDTLNELMADLEQAISHIRLGEMSKTFVQACQIVNRE